MLRKLAKIAVAAAGFIAVAGSANAASVGSAQLDLAAKGEIVAIAEDGNSYSKLESSGLTFSGDVRVSMNTGKVHGYAVYHGVCGPGQCGTTAFKLLHLTDTGGKTNVNDDISFPVSAGQFPLGLTPNTQGSQILGACNDRMNSLSQNDETFTHYVRVTLGLSLSQLTTEGFDAGALPDDYNEDFGVPVTVRCKAPPRQQPDMAYDHGPLRVRSIELDLNTYSHSNHTPSPALTCRILHVAVRIETSGKGLVHFDLSKIIGDGGLEVTALTLEAKHHDGRFFADYHKTWKFSKTTEVKFRAATKGAAIFNAHAMFTPWKSKTVECENAGGGGGYTQEIPPRDLPELPKLTGDLSFIDSGGTHCPRGKALISFKNPNNSNIHYSLDCTGESFSGVLKPVPHPQGGYVAGTLVDLGVKKTTQMNCALKTVSPTKGLHALKGHFFQCVRPTDTGGASDLVPETGPDPKGPSGPRVVVDPVRTPDPPKSDANVVTGTRIICVGGIVKTGACRCAGVLKPVPTGNNAWRCTKVVVDPLPGGKGSSATNATLNLGKKTGQTATSTRLKIDALKLPAGVGKKSAPAGSSLAADKAKAAKKVAPIR